MIPCCLLEYKRNDRDSHLATQADANGSHLGLTATRSSAILGCIAGPCEVGGDTGQNSSVTLGSGIYLSCSNSTFSIQHLPRDANHLDIPMLGHFKPELSPWIVWYLWLQICSFLRSTFSYVGWDSNSSVTMVSSGDNVACNFGIQISLLNSVWHLI